MKICPQSLPLCNYVNNTVDELVSFVSEPTVLKMGTAIAGAILLVATIQCYKSISPQRVRLTNDQQRLLANDLFNRGERSANLKERLRCFQQALKLGRTVFPENHEFIGKNLERIGMTLNFLGRHEEALESSTRARQVFENLPDGDHYRAKSLNAVGFSLENLGRRAEAMTAYREAIAIFGDEGHLDMSATLYNAAACLLNGPRSTATDDEARGYLQECITMSRHLWGLDSPQEGIARNLLQQLEAGAAL